VNLKREELEELNRMLADRNLAMPAFRRSVSPAGTNYHWLKKHLGQRNELPARLKELLGLPVAVSKPTKEECHS
jgi:hypothetical protein